MINIVCMIKINKIAAMVAAIIIMEIILNQRIDKCGKIREIVVDLMAQVKECIHKIYSVEINKNEGIRVYRKGE